MVRHFPEARARQLAPRRLPDGRLHLLGLLHHRIFLPTQGAPARLPGVLGDARSDDAADVVHPRRVEQVKRRSTSLNETPSVVDVRKIFLQEI